MWHYLFLLSFSYAMLEPSVEMAFYLPTTSALKIVNMAKLMAFMFLLFFLLGSFGKVEVLVDTTTWRIPLRINISFPLATPPASTQPTTKVGFASLTRFIFMF